MTPEQLEAERAAFIESMRNIGGVHIDFADRGRITSLDWHWHTHWKLWQAARAQPQRQVSDARIDDWVDELHQLACEISDTDENGTGYDFSMEKFDQFTRAALESLASAYAASSQELVRRPSRSAAERAIDNFLASLFSSTPPYGMCEDGEPENGDKCGWAFWIEDEEGNEVEGSTTSYVHADLGIEYYGPCGDLEDKKPTQPSVPVDYKPTNGEVHAWRDRNDMYLHSISECRAAIDDARSMQIIPARKSKGDGRG